MPPKAYGGTEYVIAELAKGLVRLGHHVTVYATGDSHPAGELFAHFPVAQWPPSELQELEHVAFSWRDISRRTPAFDVVHGSQPASLAMAHASGKPIPTVVTLHHDRVEASVDFYRAFSDAAFVAISERQAELVPELKFAAVVHHGLDPDGYPEGPGDGGYCAFLGRFAPEKAPHVAIDAARRAGVPIRLGGEPHWTSKTYFEGEVAPRLADDGNRAQWLRELSFGPKLDLLRGARALLFPIAWEEPFGLVMIEAMLAGTPVIAFPRGSAPEVVEPGVTGVLVRDVDEMADALRTIDRIDRRACRARAIERWSHIRMARDYERVYREAVARQARNKGNGATKEPEQTRLGALNRHETESAE